jgi:thiol:disulfide interchange protein
MDRTDPLPPPQSQSRISPVLFWVLLAAVLFRVVTAVMDRKPTESGLVKWAPRENAAAISRAHGKPILYDFTAAWCGPCHLLDREWNDPRVAERINQAFVPTHVVDRNREDGHNPPEVDQLQRRYEVTAFPTLVIASADGQLIGKLEGYRGRDALVNFLEGTGRK